MQKQRNQVSNARLYPVQLPEQRIDGVTFQPSTKLLRIKEYRKTRCVRSPQEGAKHYRDKKQLQNRS